MVSRDSRGIRVPWEYNRGLEAFAHVWSPDRSSWDMVLIDNHLDPYMEWVPESEVGNAPSPMLIDGFCPFVTLSTPPGTGNGGTLWLPSNELGSPTVELVSIVGEDTMVDLKHDRKIDDPSFETQIHLLLNTVAYESDGAARTLPVKRGNDEVVQLLGDYDGDRVLFWHPNLGHTLMAFVASEEGALSYIPVDEDLIPLKDMKT